MKEDEICGTTNPTSHQVLLDTRFELPFGMYATLCHRASQKRKVALIQTREGLVAKMLLYGYSNKIYEQCFSGSPNLSDWR